MSMTPQEWIECCREEGGLIEGLEAGLTHKDLDKSDIEFVELVEDVFYTFQYLCKLSDELEEYVKEMESEDAVD